MLNAACQSFQPARLETMESVRAMHLAAQIPSDDFVIEIESPYLTGVFDVFFTRDAEAMRLQLFPDLGGKVLDLTIRREGIDALMPGQSYRAEPPFDAARPHLALILAVILAELNDPVVPGRIIGERVCGVGVLEVKLQPFLGAGQVIAVVGQAGEIDRYRFRLGALKFYLESDGSFHGRGFAGRVCP